MCDYSLDLVASRPAKVGDKLVTTNFPHTVTRGFASLDDRNVAVCLLPGTELAFEDEVRFETGFVLSWRLGHRVAKFQQINKGRSNVHHDALEFPDGKIVLLTQLCEGQHATVLQLPALPRVTADNAQLARFACYVAGRRRPSRLVLAYARLPPGRDQLSAGCRSALWRCAPCQPTNTVARNAKRHSSAPKRWPSMT